MHGDSLARCILEMIYLENIPALFNFAATSLPDQEVINSLLGPLWKSPSKKLLNSTSKDWLKTIFEKENPH